MTQLLIGDILIHVGTEFGSDAETHRPRLRQALRDYLQRDVDSAQLESLHDLAAIPRITGWAISISHCRKLGGFVATRASDEFAHCGLDFERSARVTPEIAKRIAAFAGEPAILSEIQYAGLPLALFWAAKEAAIKAFGNRDPLLAPHFGVISITKMDLVEFSFEAKYANASATGVLFSLADDLRVAPINANSEIVGAFVEVAPLFQLES